MYRLGRFNTLIKYKGASLLRFGDHITNQANFVWWWPVNWVVLPIAQIVIDYRHTIQELEDQRNGL